MQPNPSAFGQSPKLRRICPKSLRLAEEEGPQRIGERKTFIVTAERKRKSSPVPEGMPLGKWLVANTPRGTNLEIPSRHRGKTSRKTPFIDEESE